MYFQTIAALDLETTDFTFPKITELSILACERKQCEEYNQIPRVLHKLSICINPNSKVHPAVTSITRLDNEDLANVSRFDDRVVEILDNFLSRLAQPVCLVAHNGIKFDFPLLKKELMNCGEVNLNNIYCADSLIAFRLMFSKTSSVFKELISSQDDGMDTEAIEKVEKDQMRIQNESTPAKAMDPLLMAPKKLTKRSPRLIECSARRKLDFAGGEDPSIGVGQEKPTPLTVGPVKAHLDCRGSPRSFKLGDLYEFLHGHRFLGEHTAEGDAHALLECLVKCSNIFKWIDVNAIPFNSVASR